MHEAAYLLAGFALLSTLLALLRDRLLAHTFGAGVTLDLYYAAFRTPDFIYTIVASMVSVFVLVPFLAQQDNERERRIFIHTVMVVFGGLLLLASVVAMLAAPQVVQYVFADLVERGYGDTLVALTRILLIQPVILGFSGMVSSVVQYHGRYFVYAVAPLLYNLGIIAGVLFFVPHFGIYGVGYGVVIGALLHLSVQLPSFARLGYITREGIGKLHDALRVAGVSVVRTLALTANHLALFVLTALAGRMPEGSIAVFTLALNLQSAPLSIIGASYSTAAFPTLSRLYISGDGRGFANQVTSAVRHIIFWSLPIIALTVVLRAHVVRVIYGSGEFSWTDTRLTAAAVALFVLSLAAQGVTMLFVRGYYAAGKMWKPLIVSVATALTTIILAYVLTMSYATHELLRNFLEALTRTADTGNTVVLMLPLAYSLSSVGGALLFMVLFFLDFREGTERIGRTLIESVVGAFFIGVGAYCSLYILDGVFDTDTFLGIFAQGALAGTAGLMLGISILLLIGNKETRLVWDVLHRKFWRVRIPSDDQL